MLVLAARTVAVSCCVWPTARLADEGDNETEATGTGGGAVTVTADEPLTPPLVAVMGDEPAMSALTSPDAETVATPVLLDDQFMVRPVRTLPPASRATADN